MKDKAEFISPSTYPDEVITKINVKLKNIIFVTTGRKAL